MGGLASGLTTYEGPHSALSETYKFSILKRLSHLPKSSSMSDVASPGLADAPDEDLDHVLHLT